MMNRNLMNRQMFRDGGAAFPDLSGDGKVTQKDILIGRGVVPMEKGGMAPMLSTSDIQLFLQNFPGYLEKNGSLYDQNGNVKLEVKQTIMDLKSAEPPVNVPTPSRQPQISPEQLQIFLENNPGYLEEEGSVYGEGGNLKPGVLPPPVGMQEGGMAMPPQGMMPAAPPAAMPEMAQAQQAGMDPAVLEGMLSQASQGIMALDEAEDYEQVMNSMRETDATVEERRMELADIVGEQDAQQTPESVLTLVQPVMMMAKTDQGIGGLAQGEMTEPVTGDMAAGIMSTVNMCAEEGPAPVNFNQGGVVGMEKGGDPLLASYKARLPLYEQIAGIDPAVTKQGQDLDKAQMLFALAQGGLQLASPTDRRMSLAEKLALSSQGVLQNISGIAAGSAERKAQEDAAMRQARFGALQAAEQDLTAQAKAKQALDLKALEGTQEIAALNLKDRLDTKRQTSLANLEQQGRLGLEELKQVNRESLEAIQQQNNIDILELEQDGSKQSLYLANQLKQNNIKLSHQLDLNKLGISQAFELSKLDKVYEQTTALQDSRLKLQEEIASNRLEFDKVKEETDQAQLALDNLRADASLALDYKAEDRLERAQTKLNDLNAKKLEIEKREINLKETSAELGIFGNSLVGKVKGILEGEGAANLAERYANNLTDPDETARVEGSINYYTNPQTVYDKELGADVRVEANKLIQMWEEAIEKRRANHPNASSPTVGSETQTREVIQESSTQKIDGPSDKEIKYERSGDFDITYENLLNEIADPEIDITGRQAAAGAFLNKAGEFLTGRLLFKDIGKAQTLLSDLNTAASSAILVAMPGKEAEQFRQEIKGMLPSVGKFTVGSETSINEFKTIEAFYNQQLAGLMRRRDSAKPVGVVGDLNRDITVLTSFRDTYKGVRQQLEAEENQRKFDGKKPGLGTFMRSGANSYEEVK